jgi:hypothetical protein
VATRVLDAERAVDQLHVHPETRGEPRAQRLRRRRSATTSTSPPTAALSSSGVAERDDPARVEDGDAVAALRLLEVVRAEQDRQAGRVP